jgi:hypothetical protein
MLIVGRGVVGAGSGGSLYTNKLFDIIQLPEGDRF